MAAAAAERARLDALREERLTAAAEAEERARIVSWEDHFVNMLRAERVQATWDEDRASSSASGSGSGATAPPVPPPGTATSSFAPPAGRAPGSEERHDDPRDSKG